MKRILYAVAAVAASMTLWSCDGLIDSLIGGEDSDSDDTGTESPEGGTSTPGIDSGSGLLPYEKYLSSIEYSFKDYNDEEPETHRLTYQYDALMRIARILEVAGGPDSDDCWSYCYDFNYDIVGEVTVTVSDAETFEKVSIMTATLDESGRVSRIVERELGDAASAYVDVDELKYDVNGYLAKIIDNDNYSSSSDSYSSYMELFHTDGLLTGLGYMEYGDYEREDFDIEKAYPNRYVNDKTNVDINTFIMNGSLELDAASLFLSARMCGKLSDCLWELPGDRPAFAEPSTMLPGYTEPNKRIPMSYTTTEWVPSDKGTTYEFFDGCPLGAGYVECYEQYEVSYDIVVGNEVEFTYTDGEDESGNPIEIKCYKWTTENYKKTKVKDIECPVTFLLEYL